MKRINRFLAVAATVSFALFGANAALAVNEFCDLIGAECVVNSVHNVSGPFTIDRTLHITGTGALVTGAVGINITIAAGDFVMDAGALIDGNVNGGGCPGTGGPITVTLANGDVDLKTGSTIRSNSCSGGAIKIATSDTHTIDIDGTVESVGAQSGTGAVQTPGGGTITIVAGCELTVSDTGLVSSRGKDPGADLVHLQGCTVNINGIVESTATDAGGHALPNSPANHCNLDTAAHPGFGPNPITSGYTTCVEIWGNTVTINANAPHTGEVNAGGVRTDGPARRGWIDIFARSDITIIADTVAPYAVHAEAFGGTGQFGGLINVKSQLGKVVTTALVAGTKGLAIQANATGNGSKGGDIIVQAGGAAPNGEVDFTADSILASGPNAGGGTQEGGHISGQSFKDDVLGILPGELNADGGGGGGVGPGTVILRACGTANYTGTSTPAAIQTSGVDCGLDPTFPAVANWSTGQTVTSFFTSAATCETRCNELCSKSGRKFNDVLGTGINDPAYPGIAGVQIHIFSQLGVGVFHDHQLTGVGGVYSFTGLLPGSYYVCEQGGPPVQTYPPADQTLGECATHVGVAGSRGYAITLVAGTDSCTDTGNDFGNHQIECPEDPKAVLTRTVSNPGSGLPNYPTLQAAYNAAGNGETIGMFGKTVENVILDGAKTLKITQCTSARITAANSALPVWTISSTGKLTIVGPDSVGGNIGWWLQTPNHVLKSIRANGASQYGVLIDSNGNQVSWNDVSGNGPGAGIRVNGSSNILKGGTVGPNSGDGVQLFGNSNTLSGATVQSNTGNGVNATGSTNKIKSNKANSNTLDGFLNAAGAGNNYSGNSSNTGGKENGGAEYRFTTAGVNGGSNRSDGVNVPSAAEGCTSFAAGQVCE